MYPWHPPASFFPHVHALEKDKEAGPASTPTASTSTPAANTSASVVSTSTTVASTSTSGPSTSALIASTSTPATSASQPAESASGRVVKEKKEARRRLPEEANDVLKQYYNTSGCDPTPAQRRELLALINAVPGAEWYSMNHISRWFAARRATAKKQEGEESNADQCSSKGNIQKRKSKKHYSQTETMTSANILWPSLDILKTAKLAVLHRDNPNPNDAVLAIWSRALKADKDDVYNWVQMNSLKAPTNVALKSLPTSGSTDSPEPVKQEPISKMSMFSPTENFAMLPSSPVERKPMLPIDSPPPPPTTPAISIPATTSPPLRENVATLQPLIIPTGNPISPPATCTPSSPSTQPITTSQAAQPSPSCPPQALTFKHHQPITQLPTPVEPPRRSPLILPPLTQTEFVQWPPVQPKCQFVHHPLSAQASETVVPLPALAARSPLIPQPEFSFVTRQENRPESSNASVAPVVHNTDAERSGVIPLPAPAVRSPLIPQPAVSFVTSQMIQSESSNASVAPVVHSTDTEHPDDAPLSHTTEEAGRHSPAIAFPIASVEPPRPPTPSQSSLGSSESTSEPLASSCLPPTVDEDPHHDEDVDHSVAAPPSPQVAAEHSCVPPKATVLPVDSPPSIECPMPVQDSPMSPVQPEVVSTAPPPDESALHGASALSDPGQLGIVSTTLPPDEPASHEPSDSPDVQMEIAPSSEASPDLVAPINMEGISSSLSPNEPESHKPLNPSNVPMEIAVSPVVSPDLAEPTSIASPQPSTPPLTVSASPAPEDIDYDVPMDLESTPSTPLTPHPPNELSCTVQIEPRRNILAELATFVDDKLSHAASGPAATKSSTQDFNEALRASEAFFERIKSGVYSSQGLVFRDTDDS